MSPDARRHAAISSLVIDSRFWNSTTEGSPWSRSHSRAVNLRTATHVTSNGAPSPRPDVPDCAFNGGATIPGAPRTFRVNRDSKTTGGPTEPPSLASTGGAISLGAKPSCPNPRNATASWPPAFGCEALWPIARIVGAASSIASAPESLHENPTGAGTTSTQNVSVSKSIRMLPPWALHAVATSIGPDVLFPPNGIRWPAWA